MAATITGYIRGWQTICPLSPQRSHITERAAGPLNYTCHHIAQPSCGPNRLTRASFRSLSRRPNHTKHTKARGLQVDTYSFRTCPARSLKPTGSQVSFGPYFFCVCFVCEGMAHWLIGRGVAETGIREFTLELLRKLPMASRVARMRLKVLFLASCSMPSFRSNSGSAIS